MIKKDDYGSSFYLSVYFNEFLGKMMEWFPVDFSTVFNAASSFSLTGYQSRLENPDYLGSKRKRKEIIIDHV